MSDHHSSLAPDTRTNSESTSTKTKPERNLLEDYLGAVIMGILAVITFANVIVRYFTNQSFAWTEEISIFLMIVLTMFGASAAFVRQHHIRIEYFADRTRPATQQRLRTASRFLSMLMFGSLAILSARLVWDDFRFDETTPAIGIPQWWYSIWMPLLSVLIFVRLAIQTIRSRKAS